MAAAESQFKVVIDLDQTLFIDKDGDGIFEEGSGENVNGIDDTGDVDGIFIL